MFIVLCLYMYSTSKKNPSTLLPYPTLLYLLYPYINLTRDGILYSDEGVAGEDRDYFPASRLFEYRWPVEQERAELYFLQEQVAEFLKIRGIQRKYPGIVGGDCPPTCQSESIAENLTSLCHLL